MGFKLTWVSVKDSDRTVLLRTLRLQPSGQLTVDPQDGIVGRAHGADRYVVVAVDDRGGLMNTGLLERLSRSVPLLVCHVHEGCMSSHAAEWAGGIELWRVAYDGDRSKPFEVAGHPPSVLERICAETSALQNAESPRRRAKSKTGSSDWLPPDFKALLDTWNAGRTPSTMPPPDVSTRVDHMFGVPIALCESLTSLRHDHASFWNAPPFERLVPAS